MSDEQAIQQPNTSEPSPERQAELAHTVICPNCGIQYPARRHKCPNCGRRRNTFWPLGSQHRHSNNNIGQGNSRDESGSAHDGRPLREK